jgi:hypothetical protein
MLELLFALLIGMILGYLLKKESKPPVVDTLTSQVEYYEKELKYYKDLCKWHIENKDECFEKGRQQGMKQERALWNLAASSEEIGSYSPAPKELEGAIDKALGIERKK